MLYHANKLLFSLIWPTVSSSSLLQAGIRLKIQQWCSKTQQISAMKEDCWTESSPFKTLGSPRWSSSVLGEVQLLAVIATET